MKRIYLDNAATSWPKPELVYSAVDRYLRENGAPAGRSAYHEATEVDRAISAARASLARLIGAVDARRIVFTSNGTDSLNLAIHGLLKPGDHAVCTDADHNSVLRPLRFLEDHRQIEVARVRCDSAGLVDPDDIRCALRPNTRLVVMPHATNVTGVLEPVADIGKVVREHGARFLVDAAQSLGHWPISVDEMQIDLLAAPGHKGLLGPLGTGALYIREGIESEVDSICQGGTGTSSDIDRQPNLLPEKYESGNHNVPGLVGLAAALAWLESQTAARIVEHEQKLNCRLRSGLRRIAGLKVHEPRLDHCTVGVVSFSVPGYDPQEAAAVLDATFGIQVRAGLHCAPGLHAAMGTLKSAGTVRFSLGPFNTETDIDAAIGATAELMRSV